MRNRRFLGGIAQGVLGALLAGGCGSGGASVGTHGNSEKQGDALASTRAGMGATPYPGGVTFRVFAPFAKSVSVAGDFNSWSQTATPLFAESNGNWSADVPSAQRWQQYRYVVVDSNGNNLWKQDPRSAQLVSSAGNSIIHDPAEYQWANSFGQPSFDEMVVYELHIGSFTTTFPGPGTWKSAMSKLDYLQALGVNMLEVMPVGEFPGSVSEGYDPAFPFAPTQNYGTPENMKAFIDGAHQRGMGVILDIVHNHYGPNDLSMWCIDGNCLGNGGVYFYTDWRAATPWGNTRPDYGRPEVRDYIRDNAMMWLNEYHLDGLRWDGTKWIRTLNGDGTATLNDGWTLMQTINWQVSSAQPWKILIAEDFGGIPSVTVSTQNGGAGFTSQWDGSFVHPIRDAVTQMNDAMRNMGSVAAAIGNNFNGQASQRVIYTESHDEDSNGHSRLPEEIWPNNAGSWASKKRSTLAAGLAFTSPGIPMIFQGQEWLENGWWQPGFEIDWTKATTFSGITQLYRDLAHLRRNFNNNTRGLRGDGLNIHHLNDNGKVIAFHRWQAGGPGDDVVVVANFSSAWYPSYSIGFPRGGSWYVRFNSDWNGYSSDFGNTTTLDLTANGGPLDGMGQSGSFQLGPYSLVIFSQ